MYNECPLKWKLNYVDRLTEFTDNEGKRLVGSMVRRGFSKDNLMFILQGVEYELSATRMLALMRNIKGKLKRFLVSLLNFIKVSEFGLRISIDHSKCEFFNKSAKL